MTNMKVKISS